MPPRRGRAIGWTSRAYHAPHLINPIDLPQVRNNLFQMGHIDDVERYLDRSFLFTGARFDILNIGLDIADGGSNLGKEAAAVGSVEREPDRIETVLGAR